MARADIDSDRPPSSERTRRPRSKARAAWVPKQHGAWAMLAAPFIVGAVRGGWDLAHLPLAVSWVVGYLGFAAAGLWLRSRRKPVYRPAVLTYGAVSLAAGLILLAMRPDLMVWAPVFAPFAVVSLWFSARRRDRALGNDVVTIVAASLMTLVAACTGRLGEGAAAAAHGFAGVGSAASLLAVLTDPPLVGATLALSLYLVGTSLYVKTLIRERTSQAYKRASIAYHCGATALWLVVPLLLPAAWAPPTTIHALLVAFFAVTTLRAGVLAGRPIRPMTVGLGEIVLSTVLTVILICW